MVVALELWLLPWSFGCCLPVDDFQHLVVIFNDDITSMCVLMETFHSRECTAIDPRVGVSLSGTMTKFSTKDMLLLRVIDTDIGFFQ